MTTNNFSNSSAVALDRVEVYDPTKQTIWPFKHVDDIVEGIKLDLCNMTSCYPFVVEGIKWRSSEELYLAGEFSNDTAEHRSIQEELRAAKSPYASKRFVKGKHRKEVRSDFSEFRTQWMLWCGRNAKVILTLGVNSYPFPIMLFWSKKQPLILVGAVRFGGVPIVNLLKSVSNWQSRSRRSTPTSPRRILPSLSMLRQMQSEMSEYSKGRTISAKSS